MPQEQAPADRGAGLATRLPQAMASLARINALARHRWVDWRRRVSRRTDSDVVLAIEQATGRAHPNEEWVASDPNGLGSTAGSASPPEGDLVREGCLVRLRTQVPANRAAFQRWYADPEIAALLRHDQEPLNEIQSRGYFDTIILPLSARGLCYAIHEAATDRLIGSTALTDITPGPRSALFRIVIGEKDCWGRGYGTEATRLVAEEAFSRHGLDQIRLEVFQHNERAIRAYQRVGFHRTGEHVEWVGRPRFELHVLEMTLDRDALSPPRPVSSPAATGDGDDGALPAAEPRRIEGGGERG